MFNPCNWENVAFTGIDHFTARLTFSGNGGFHLDPFTFSEITKGSAANFEVHAIFQITILANGTVTAFVNNITAVCRG